MVKDPNPITVRGRLTADPEIVTMNSGRSLVKFTIVSNGRSRDSQSGEWSDGIPTFWNCRAWRDLADHIASSFSKGSEVIALLRPDPQSWQDKEGNNRRRVDWLVEDMGPSVLHATTVTTRVKRASGFHPSPQGTNPGDAPHLTRSQTRVLTNIQTNAKGDY